MIPVITISREFGTEGENIAEKIAEILGYHFVDKEFIRAILNEYGMVDFDHEYESLPGFWEQFSATQEDHRDVMVSMLNKVVRAMAHHGNMVILGRSGFEVLINYYDVLRVRLQSPFEVRVEQVMTQQNLSDKKASALVTKNDKVRMAFMKEFYKAPWRAIQAFDLVINTCKISPDLAANWVVQAVKSYKKDPLPEQLGTDSIEVDPILASTISAKLKCNLAHSTV
jgi:cytidylate kinase